MSVTTESAQQFLNRRRHRAHPRRVVCSEASPCALGLQFGLLGDGSVEATLDCPNPFQGYPERLHGGVIPSLPDGAMPNCLFARGIVAVAAELNVRFRQPVRTGVGLAAHARGRGFAAPLYVVEAGPVQEDQVRAEAVGKFMQAPGDPRR